MKFLCQPQPMKIPRQALRMTVRIQFESSTGWSNGTATRLYLNSQRYLLTAGHVVRNRRSGAKLEFFKDGKWNSLEYRPIPDLDAHYDVAAMWISEGTDLDEETMLVDATELYVGQEIRFLGFPLSLSTDSPGANSGFPVAFAKQGIISSFGQFGPRMPIMIDALNTSGFSGGPVFVKSKKSSFLELAGIISGYKHKHIQLASPDGKTAVEYAENTGITVAFSIQGAIDIIRENPLGSAI
jgi:hypothetical protein